MLGAIERYRVLLGGIDLLEEMLKLELSFVVKSDRGDPLEPFLELLDDRTGRNRLQPGELSDEVYVVSLNSNADVEIDHHEAEDPERGGKDRNCEGRNHLYAIKKLKHDILSET